MTLSAAAQRALLGALAALFFTLPIGGAFAYEGCQAVSSAPPRVIPASFAALEARLSFIGHATFVIESPTGIRAATDYNDYVRPAFTPDVATMNRAHSTHYTDHPDPAIKHVLRGWEAGGAARHDVIIGDMRVRSVPTNIRDWMGGTISAGNSIFVFELAGLCIAHLGHLHHTLRPEHLADLGPVDVALVPVDGGWTMNLDVAMEVIAQISPKLIVPMHYFGPDTLRRFLARAETLYPVEFKREAVVALSREAMPEKTQILVLPGR